MKLETLAVHAGYKPDPTTHSVAVPIYQTTSYAFDDTQHGADLFNLAVPGNIYTRITNPTNAVLEERVAALEGGVGGLALASGMAAITAAIQTITEMGDISFQSLSFMVVLIIYWRIRCHVLVWKPVLHLMMILKR